MILWALACSRSAAPPPLLPARVAGRHLAAEGWLLPSEGPVLLPADRVTLTGVPEGCIDRQEQVLDGPLTVASPAGCRVFAVDPRGAPVDDPRPDVLVLTVDTLRADHVGASDALQAFSDANLAFTNTRAPSPWTYPSALSLLLGQDLERRTAHNGVLKPAESLASTFQLSGYRTVAFVGNPLLMANVGLEGGFDRYELIDGDANVIQAALQAIQQDGPQFVYAHLMGGHLPYHDEHQTFDARGAARAGEWDHDQERIKSLYASTVRLHTQGLEALFAEAEVAVFTADHGEELWDHGGFEHGHAFWEELLHVPLVFKAPGLSGARDDPARLQDVAPTLTALAGLPGTGWTGRNLLGTDAPQPLWARHLLLEGPWDHAVVDWPWKLIDGSGGPVLYRLPNEQDPVDDPEQVARMQALWTERPTSALLPSPPRPNVDHDQVLHLRVGGEGPLRLSLEADSTLAFSMDTPPRVCGDVTTDAEAYRVEVTLDVAPVACELLFAPLNADDEVRVLAWNDSSRVEVEWVQGPPEAMNATGPLAVQVGQGSAWHIDLSQLKALGYVD